MPLERPTHPIDPTLKFKISAMIKDRMRAFPPKMRRAAKYIIDRPSDFGLDSIRQTSARAGVSTYTLVNIAKKLGFDSFEDLRQPFRHALVASPLAQGDAHLFEAARSQGRSGQVYADAAENALSITQASLERQDPQVLEAIVDAMFSARTVFVSAVRSSYAIAYFLHYVGRMALPTLRLAPRQMNSAIDDLNDAEPGDVLIAITVSPYSRETIEACAFARKKGLKLILLSDSELALPDLDADHMLVASTQSTHNFGSFLGLMAVTEALLALLMQRGGPEAQARIASYETLRIETNAYWFPQKKH